MYCWRSRFYLRACGDLGYNGLNGRRAREAIIAMERMINEFEKETGIRLR